MMYNCNDLTNLNAWNMTSIAGTTALATLFFIAFSIASYKVNITRSIRNILQQMHHMKIMNRSKTTVQKSITYSKRLCKWRKVVQIRWKYTIPSQKRKPALPRFYQLMMYSAHEACYSSSYIRNIRTRNTNCTNTISFLFTPFKAGRDMY